MANSEWFSSCYFLLAIRYSLFAPPADAPDCAVAVLGKDERAAFRLHHPDRPAPDRRIVDHEAGDEVFVFAGRHAVLHDRADDLVPGARRPVPGAVLGREDAALELGRELVAGIEHQLQRCRMGLDQHVRNDDLVLEIGALARVLWILMRPHIVPRPAIETALA